jgi:NADPH2:quinone reductase
MRASVQVGFGSIADAIVVSDVPVPTIAPGKVLLRVLATTLNRKDVFALRDLKGPGIRPRPPLPHVHGGDVVGEIESVAGDVRGWSAGERVVAYSGLFCGTCEFCEAGETSACVNYGVLGEQTWGAHAEYVLVPARNLERVASDVPLDHLACAGASWATAWGALTTVARVQAGETVLVVGASGGVGTGAIRIAKFAGCRVIAVVGGAWKVKAATDAGADHAFDYSGTSFRSAVMDITDGRGVDVVLDSVGAATWRDSINVLRPFGRLAICGATAGDAPEISIREIYQQHRRILGAPLGSLSDFRRMVRCVVSGDLPPVVGVRLPLERIQQGLTMLEDRSVFGKVIVTPAAIQS